MGEGSTITGSVPSPPNLSVDKETQYLCEWNLSTAVLPSKINSHDYMRDRWMVRPSKLILDIFGCSWIVLLYK